MRLHLAGPAGLLPLACSPACTPPRCLWCPPPGLSRASVRGRQALSPGAEQAQEKTGAQGGLSKAGPLALHQGSSRSRKGTQPPGPWPGVATLGLQRGSVDRGRRVGGHGPFLPFGSPRPGFTTCVESLWAHSDPHPQDADPTACRGLGGKAAQFSLALSRDGTPPTFRSEGR